MRRRDFAGGMAAASMAWPFAALAQQPAKPPRIGLLSNDPHSRANAMAFWGAFRDGLQTFGWIADKTVAFELISADGDYDRLPQVARELVGRGVDLIVVAGGLAAIAVRDATTSIPAVFVGVADPVGTGLVASLAQPGGNITGLANMSNELIAKRLEFLLEVAEGAKRIACLTYETGSTWFDDEAARVAAAIGLQWQQVMVVRQQDLAATITAHTDADAWFVSDAILIFPRDLVVSQMAAHRKPVIYPNSTFVRLGGLMSYGANSLAQARRAAHYVDRILRGARPAEIPVEQPTSFELMVNLKTAKGLGLTLPPALLARADEVIE